MCSEAKAKAAVLYNYRNVMSGFSARLTPPELEAVKSKLLYLFNLLLVYLIYTVRVDHTMHGRQASSSPNGVLSDYIACLVGAEQPQVNRVLPSATLSLMSSKFDGVS